MQSIQLKTHVGEDGLLKVQMPPEIKDMELDVMVLFQPLSNIELHLKTAITLSGDCDYYSPIRSIQ